MAMTSINIKDFDQNIINQIIEPAYQPANIFNFLNISQLIILNSTLILQNGLQFIPFNVTIEGNNITFLEVTNQNLSDSFPNNGQFQCNISFTYNQSLVSQMCQSNESWYLIQFEFICFNFNNCNFFNQTIIPFEGNNGQFQRIIKFFSIDQYNQLMLANYEDFLPQLYLLYTQENSYNIYDLFIQCDTGIVDFIVFQSVDFIIISYICENVMYYYLWLYGIEFLEAIGYKPVFNIYPFISPPQSQLVSINLLSNDQDTQIILLTTNNAVSFILTTLFSSKYTNKGLYWDAIVQKIIKTIPPYGNDLQQSWESNGLILLAYKFQDKKVYAIYDWVTMSDSITTPLIIKGGFESASSQSITFNLTNNGGYIFQLINGQIYGYIVSSSAYLNCTFKHKKDVQIKFDCNSIIINFQYTPQQEWVIGLIIFVAIVFSIAIFFYWYKTKDIIEETSLLEEIELEQ